MNSGLICYTNSYSAYHNLATEEYLIRECEKNNIPILFIWQNENAVVIGKNQNAYTECNIEFAKENTIQIVRRTTGGGAVYHDLGNINFSIILPKFQYDTEKTIDMIVAALNNIGVNAKKNGRNDICIGEEKISGNAFYSNEKVGMHHGTILYELNETTMASVLSVPKYKLSKHGVSSVKSRVTDIKSKYPRIQIEDIFKTIKNQFMISFGLSEIEEKNIDKNDINDSLIKKYYSDEWNINKICQYETLFDKLFDWGYLRMTVKYEGNQLVDLEFESDSLEVDVLEEIKERVKLNIGMGINMPFSKAIEEFESEKTKRIATDIYELCSETDL